MAERIYQSVRGETGLTDVKFNIYNSTGTQVVTNASGTELGSTGIYYYDYDWSTSDKYLVIITSSEMAYQSNQLVYLGTISTSTTPSSSVAYTDVKFDIGQAYNMIDIATTSAVVNAQIVNAEEDVKLITATTDGYVQAIRYLADAYSVNAALGSLGPESELDTKFINMRDEFMNKAKSSLRRKGKDFDNINAAWKQVNG